MMMMTQKMGLTQKMTQKIEKKDVGNLVQMTQKTSLKMNQKTHQKMKQKMGQKRLRK